MMRATFTTTNGETITVTGTGGQCLLAVAAWLTELLGREIKPHRVTRHGRWSEVKHEPR